MTTTTAPAGSSREFYVERLLECYATEHRGATLAEQQDAAEQATVWLDAADQDGVDLYADSLALQEQARQQYLATL